MTRSTTRRELLRYGAVVGAGLLSHCHTHAAPNAPTMETHIYKTVDGHPIKADVYQQTGNCVRPAVIWLHGGALINGHRGQIDERLKQHALNAGYVLISIDYRLAPETKLPDLIKDIEDAFGWIRRKGPRQFNIDPSHLAVAGASAGGYLTLTSGFRVEPRPSVLFSLYGYGDLIGNWYSTPSPHPRHHTSNLSHEEAWRQVSGPVISNSNERNGNGGAFYQYCRQTGSWPTSVSGWDPIKVS